MKADILFNSAVPRVILVAALVVVGYYLLDQTIGGSVSRAILLSAMVYSGLVIVNPRLGLYALCVSLLLMPARWEGAVTNPLSANLVVMATALWAWGMSVVLGNFIVRSTVLYIPLAIVGAVTWIGLVRYGSGFYNVPLIFSESVVLFVLTLHLLKDRVHLRRLLIVLAIAYLVRNSIDVVQTLISLQSGSALGAIRSDQLLFGSTATTESHLRALVLPLMIMGVVYAPNLPARVLIGATLALDVAWLGLAGTRTAAIGLVIAPVATIMLLPRSPRRWAVLLVVPLGILFFLVATQLSESGSLVVDRTQRDLNVGFEGGRPAKWKAAFDAFIENPLVGSGQGVSHSYFLGSARTMGLLFLVPFFAALAIVWSHCRWLRRTQFDQESHAFAGGIMAMLAVALVLNFTGTMLAGFPSFIFWILVGAVESVYLGVRAQRAPVDEVSSRPADSIAGEPMAEHTT